MKKSLFIFLSCFMLSVVLGSVLSNLFSGDRLRSVILDQLSKGIHNVQWELEGVSVQLADGLLPAVALNIRSVTALKPAECGKRIHVRGQNGTLPLDLLSLIKGPVRLGKLKFDEVTVYEVPGLSQRCETVSHGEGTELIKQNVTDAVGRPNHLADLSQEAVPWTSLVVKRLTILNPDGVELARIQNLRSSWGAQGISIEARLTLKQFEINAISPFQFKGKLDRAFDALTFDLRWREGEISGTAKNLKTAAIEADLRGSKVSADEVYKALRALQIVKNNVAVGANWFDFSLKYSARPERRIEVSDFALTGDIGKISVGSAKLSFEPTVIEPFEAKLEAIKISEIVRMLDVDPIRRVTSQQGEFNGALKYADSKINFDGQLRDSVISFSRENRKAFQKINQANIECEYWVGKSISGTIDRIQLEDGEWLGSLKGALDLDESLADLQFNFARLSLNPQIFSTLWNVQLGAFRGNGNVVLTKGIVTELRAQTVLESVSGSGFGMRDINLQASYKSNRGQGVLTAQEFNSDRLINNKELRWTRLAGPIAYSDNTYHIGPIAFFNPSEQKRGRLTADYGSELNGRLEMESKKAGRQSWLISGPLGKIALTMNQF